VCKTAKTFAEHLLQCKVLHLEPNPTNTNNNNSLMPTVGLLALVSDKGLLKIKKIMHITEIECDNEIQQTWLVFCLHSTNACPSKSCKKLCFLFSRASLY